MLIVNMKGDAIAKVAFKAKVEGAKGIKLAFINNEDGYKPLILEGKKQDEVLVVMDCKVVKEKNNTSIPKDFEDRYEHVKGAIEKEKEEKKSKYVGGGGYYNQGKLPFRKDAGEPWTPNEVWDSHLPENVYNSHGSWRDEYENINGVWKPKKNREKKISEMTTKEFEKWEEGQVARDVFLKDQKQNIIEKFTEKHARQFLNSIIDGSYMMTNSKDLKAVLLIEDKELPTEQDLEAWLDGFQMMLQEHFDIIYYPNTVQQYGELMSVCKDYLEQYKSITLVSGMITVLEEELEMSHNPKIFE